VLDYIYTAGEDIVLLAVPVLLSGYRYQMSFTDSSNVFRQYNKLNSDNVINFAYGDTE